MGCRLRLQPKSRGIAAAALTNSGGSSINGRMTEAEYDAAMALVKKVRTEIKNQPLSEDLRKVYADGMKIIGAEPDDPFWSMAFKDWAAPKVCADGSTPIDGKCADGTASRVVKK